MQKTTELHWQSKAILSRNEVNAMHYSSEIVVLKALETPLSKAEVNEMHNNSARADLVAIKGHLCETEVSAIQINCGFALL